MGFASAYLDKRALAGAFIKDEPLDNTGIIIIVPCFDEPEIAILLDSLAGCSHPGCRVEVLVGINAPPGATGRQEEQNRKTIVDLKSWKKENENAPFRLFFFDTGISNDRQWGAGLARKILMDEALRRYNNIGSRDGIIVSLDADCTVSNNYLVALHTRFSADLSISGASIRFEHSIPGNEEDPDLRKAIIEYELHMRYYYQALRHSGYPRVFHTIGSALAVRAWAYAKAGGMNRRRAGEDFYFIQKLIPMGGFTEISEAAVYPSPRISVRVPFGTGPAVKALIENPGEPYYTYNPRAFSDLGTLVAIVPSLYDNPGLSRGEKKVLLPEGILEFLRINEWYDRVDEAIANTSGKESFVKRFYNWFNMFRVVKYLNFIHSEGYYEKVPVEEASRVLLEMITGKKVVTGGFELLEQYRVMER